MLWQLQKPGFCKLRRSDAKASMDIPIATVAKKPSASNAGVCNDQLLNKSATQGCEAPPPLSLKPSMYIVVGAMRVLHIPVGAVIFDPGHCAAHVPQ